MSELITDRVYASSQSRRGSRLVMLALAREANDQGEATVSLDAISKLSHLTPRAITTCLGELSALGELKYESGVGRGHPNRYSILIGAPAAPAGPVEPQMEVGRNFQEAASESMKSGEETSKSTPENGEFSSSSAPSVNTPVGSINTPSQQASSSTFRDSTGVPAGARDVVSAMEGAGMLVGWRLTKSEWERVTALSSRWGPERLVEVIARRWDPARPPQSARYLLRIWDDLPSQVPAEPQKNGNVVPLRRAAAGWQPFRNPTVSSAYQNGF